MPSLTPTVSVTDNGGIYNGSPFPAAATVAGADGVPGDSLEGVALTVDYYSGSSVSGIPLDAAPSMPGTYTVQAAFPGSEDYDGASASTTFIILTPALGSPLEDAAGLTSSTLDPNDDSSAGPVNLGFSVNFGGQSYSQVYVNNNGNLTFGASLSEYTPAALADLSLPIIAPFFADVDTRAGLPVTYGTGTVDGQAAFAATWNHVGYYDQHTTPTDTFQAVLIARPDEGPGAFDIEFNYGQIGWETGDASGGSGGTGGISARAGYSDGTGDANTSLELPGSGISGSLLDSNASTGLIHNSFNSNLDGRYVFEINEKLASNTTLTSSQNASVWGQSVTFTAGVSTASGGTVTPTGSVDFYDGNTLLDTETLNDNGQASFTTSDLAVATHSITASYNGDSDFMSSSVALDQEVDQAAPTLTLTDAGGTFNGSTFPATVTVAGVLPGIDDAPASNLEGVSPALDYQQVDADGNLIADLGTTAPTQAGSYTVSASFAGSNDYAS